MSRLNLKEKVRRIFDESLKAVDAGAAVRRTVRLTDKFSLKITDEVYDLRKQITSVYAVAVGKAAYPMAYELDTILGENLTAGIISGVIPQDYVGAGKQNLSPKWNVFSGGHPLPNEASLAAAQSCFKLLERANNPQSLIIFLVSGGGSAMLETPRDAKISLADLRAANEILVKCGASISEINKVRKGFSLVKGGGLSAAAPLARQVTLLVSDTESGDENSIASAPSLQNSDFDLAEIGSIIKSYNLVLPPTVSSCLKKITGKKVASITKTFHPYYVLLDNQTAISAAAETARNFGFAVDIAPEINHQNVSQGCAETMQRLAKLRLQSAKNKIVCLISGGEFACRVSGSGTGGRNAESVLRMAQIFDEESKNFSELIFLSAGTDGIDGNSLAAGAICDRQTISQARKLNLDAQKFLENSDAATFFTLLGDDLTTGATGTNVRDLRIAIAR